MSTEVYFARAEQVIDLLPKVSGPSFYQIADLRSANAVTAWRLAYEELAAMGRSIGAPKSAYFLRWAADVLTALGELEHALRTMPRPAVGSRGAAQTDRLLTLKHSVGELVTGSDIATLFGPKVTKFGRANLEEVVSFLNVQVEALQLRQGRNLLSEWFVDAHVISLGAPLFAGVCGHVIAPALPAISFSLSPTAERLCSELLREAENTLREEREIPRVGEGWLAETVLFYEIKEAFAGEPVIQHARPGWLGRQHLDIFLPVRKVAVEYQGAQHDRPVAFFGGEEAFMRTVQRDRRKLLLCKQNDVSLIYVRSGYSLRELLEEIRRLNS